MSYGALVIDANILVRAVLGNKVKQYLMDYSGSTDFFVTDTCIDEAQKYLPLIFEKRGMPSDVMKSRDIFDWPAVATALLFNCAIWTEDKDFFGVEFQPGQLTEFSYFLTLH